MILFQLGSIIFSIRSSSQTALHCSLFFWAKSPAQSSILLSTNCSCRTIRICNSVIPSKCLSRSIISSVLSFKASFVKTISRTYNLILSWAHWSKGKYFRLISVEYGRVVKSPTMLLFLYRTIVWIISWFRPKKFPSKTASKILFATFSISKRVKWTFRHWITEMIFSFSQDSNSWRMSSFCSKNAVILPSTFNASITEIGEVFMISHRYSSLWS